MDNKYGKTKNNDENESDIKGDIFKELNMLNISFNGLILVLIGVIINIRFVLWSRIGVLDSINNTNYAEKIGDLTESPRLSNKLYLIATIIFIIIIYDGYLTQISTDSSQLDKEAVNDSWYKYVAIIFVLMGTLINYSILNKPNFN